MKLLPALVLGMLIACSPAKQSEQPTERSKLAKAPENWIQDRVEKATTKLNASEAGQLIWQSIQAHGGLDRWFANGPIDFHFDYQPIGGGNRRNSYQVVDQWSVRAVHEVAENRSLKYGWDGANAWSYPDTADVGVNPRFWSTTPFYFIALPFVLADEGVILEKLPAKEFKGTTYELVKATYEAGTGDAPDDFYVIYIHPETKQMGGLRYIVSYPGYFPDGGHAPEKFMEILGLQTVEGITIPTGYHTYWFKEEEPAEHITTIDVSEVTFRPDLKKTYFEMPAGAKVQKGLTK